MKKLIFILMTVFFIFAITGCNPVDKEWEKGQFWVQNFDTKKFYQINAEKLAENSRCVVWVEEGSGVSETTANEMAEKYKNIVYEKMMETFGDEFNVPGVGMINTMEFAHWKATGKKEAKLTILLLDIKDGYKTKGDSYVGGYFTPINLYKNVPNDPDLRYSNELDMICLDTYPSVLGSASSNETLTHEMQHLMNWVFSTVFREDYMDIWIDEGLSSAAEWLYSKTHPEQRWKYYNSDSQSGLLKEGNNFYVWGNHQDTKRASLDDYTTVYLFFQWLRLQSDNNPDIYYSIISSPHYDYEAVTTVAAEMIDDIYDNNWSLLLRDWFAANYTNDQSSRYGYKNDPVLKNIKAPMFPEKKYTVDLFPGEGVYSKTKVAESVPKPSGKIKYAGLNYGSGEPNEKTGFVNGARLTYNSDTNMGGKTAKGDTTGIAADISISSGSASLQIDSYEFPESYKVDASYFLNRNINNIGHIGKSDNSIKVDRSTVRRGFVNE